MERYHLVFQVESPMGEPPVLRTSTSASAPRNLDEKLALEERFAEFIDVDASWITLIDWKPFASEH